MLDINQFGKQISYGLKLRRRKKIFKKIKNKYIYEQIERSIEQIIVIGFVAYFFPRYCKASLTFSSSLSLGSAGRAATAFTASAAE